MAHRPAPSKPRPRLTAPAALPILANQYSFFNNPKSHNSFMPQILPAANGNLYQQVAQQIAEAVDRGAYLPGDRVPSVRRLSRQLGVSISTVVQAYRLLEDSGLVEARPQSGYYVSPRARKAPPPPERSRPLPRPTPVSTGELLMDALAGSLQPGFVQLAAAVPSPELLPIRPLNRTLAALVREQAGLGESYEMPGGRPELRAQIARLSLAGGCRADADEIIVTSGCQEALTLCLRAVAQPGDTIAVESPTYHGTLQAIEALGMRALEIPTDPRSGVVLEALETALRQWPIKACLFVPNYSNPLGSCMPEEHKRRLVALLGRFEVPLIEDDIYGDLGFRPPRPKVCKAYDKRGLVLLCSSFSKTLAPGYRVGWTLPGRYTERVRHLKYLTNIGTATPTQLAIARFLAGGAWERHLPRIQDAYARQMERMIRAVGECFPAGTRVTHPAGGFVLWVELPEPADSLELYRRAREQGIGIAPGPLFSAQRRYRNCLRLNCTLPWTGRVEDAVRALGRLAAAGL